MIPQHCGDVGVAEVSFPLTEESLRKHFLGRRSYTKTEFCAVKNGRDWAVIQISKKRTKNLFQPIEDIRVLSLPERTFFVHEPDLDVLHIGNLLKVQSRHPGKMVVFQGRFEHISLVDVKVPARIRLIDIVPPNPSKLETIVKELVGESSSLMKIDVELIDISDLVKETKADVVLLPCRSSYDGMADKIGKRERYFLDQAPELSAKQIKSSLLVGCPLSARIFEEIYGAKPNLANICVRESVKSKDGIPTISRCCKIKKDVDVDDGLILVPWGANVCEVAEALRIALGSS
jgi:hypothetical protein